MTYFITYCYKDLLTRYPRSWIEVNWSTTARKSKNDLGTISKLSGHEIMALYRKNYTIKVFEKLHRRQINSHFSKKKWLGLKMDLYDEYDHPKPFPTDRYLRLPDTQPTQAYVMLGQKGTGISNVYQIILSLVHLMLNEMIETVFGKDYISLRNSHTR